MQTTKTKLYIGLGALTIAGAACSFQASVGGRSASSSPPPPQARSQAEAGSSGSAQASAPPAEAGSGGGGSQVAASADCPNPQNHCLPEDVVLVSKKGFNKRYIYLEPARQTGEPNAAGETTFMKVRDGGNLTTRHIWSTRPARPGDLAVGKLVAMLHKAKGGIYQPPETRKQAISSRWWLARLSSVANADQGYVIISGGYKVSPEALRVVQNDDSPTATVSDEVDEHFLSPDHWIISNKPLPERRYAYAEVAAAIQPPSAKTNNEGHFIDLREGEIVWTAHAWRTRPATRDDLQVGNHVFMLHKSSDGVYRKPNSRTEAVTSKWWMAKIVDASKLYRGTVDVAGGYTIAVDGLRVPIQ